MKKRNSKYMPQIVLGIMLLLGSMMHAQTNYVLNGSFEDVNSCPNRPGTNGIPPAPAFDANKFPQYWQQPTNGSTDLINDCVNTCTYNSSINPGGPWVCVTDNIMGCQPAQNGYNYVGIYTSGTTFSGGPYREMVQCTLNISGGLVAGQCYTLEFYASLSDNSAYATPLQINFSSGSTPPTQYDNTNGYYGTMGLTPQLTTRLINHTNSWEHYVFPYTALGGEKYMTIGFFEDQSSPNIVAVTPASGNCTISHPSISNAYIYIDNVSLVVSGGNFIPSTGYVYSNTTLTNINWSNKNVLLDGNITFNGATNQMTNCDVHCTKTCKITIASSSALTTDGTTFSTGCDHMWEGFELNSVSLGLFMTGGVNGGGISDAVTAINNPGGRPLQLSDNLLFKGNETDIIEGNIGTPVGSLVSFIKGTVFDHTTLLKDNIYGVGGYGIEGIKIGNQTGTSDLTIGGTNLSDMCQFLGGQYGIESDNCNLNVVRCFFSGINKVGIDFQGNNSSVFRTLTVNTGTTFMQCKRHILSQHRTNLMVQQCAFYYSQEHSIDWEDNHDGHLLIGSDTSATLGNTFTNNYWCAVVAWDNKTNFNGLPTDFVTEPTGNRTTIIISNNTVTAPIGGGGFLIGEWTQSNRVTYHDLVISENTLNNATKGIQLYNARGFGGMIPSTYSGTIPPQKINNNEINITTAATATAFAVRDENNPGFEILDNTIGSTTPSDWQNSGIIFTNSEYTSVFRNLLTAGTGIAANCDVLWSNIHCNYTDNNMSGITLAYAYLRPDSLSYHGSNIESFGNTLNTYSSAQVQIHDYNSDVDHNQWVWSADPTPTVYYSGNTGTGVLFTTITGVDNCYIPLHSIQEDTVHAHIDLGSSTQQWTADYNYEAVRLNTGVGDSTIASSNIKKLLSIERMIDTANYTGAKSALATVSSPNDFEQNYVDVLTIFADLNYPTKRDPDGTEMGTLTSIASLYPRTSGPAVTIARAYLAAKFNMYFKDEGNADTTLYGSAAISSPCSVAPYSKTYLGFVRADGTDIGVTPAVVEADGSFTFDPFTMNYMRSAFSDTVRIYSIHGSQYTVVDKEFKKIAGWIDSSPISLTMSGVSLILDTLTSEPYATITAATQFTDGSGNTYYAGTTGTGHTDMSLKKYDGRNNLIWERTWDGPVGGNDTATCITSDASGNIYIAGKVWNGSHYETQALKYDADGFLQWSSVPADSGTGNNYPTGIDVNDDDNTVAVIGTNGDSYRFIQWNQSLPGARLGHIEQPEANAVSPSNSITVYPNPSSGKLTIILPNADGGLMELFNPAGQLVFSQQISHSGEVEIPQNSVSDGLYLLKFTIGDHTEFNKLVIHRD